MATVGALGLLGLLALVPDPGKAEAAARRLVPFECHIGLGGSGVAVDPVSASD